MRRISVALSILVLLAATASVGAPKKSASSAKPAARPIVVVFETTKGEGVDKVLAASATRALCSYLHDTQRVDAVIFNQESPTVLRAVMDKQLTADQVASYSSQDERIAVAKALSYDYAAGAELTIKDNNAQIKLWVAKADGGKKDRWETSTQAGIGSAGVANYDNSMQSATSAAVIAISRLAFAGLAALPEKGPPSGSETTALGPELVAAPSAPGAADYTAQAEASLKAGNLAVAIQQYQSAVNADPTSATLRMQLVEAYARKGMYHEANAELGRAELMGASADQVAAKRKLIDAMQTGRGANTSEPSPPTPQPANATTTGTGSPSVTTGAPTVPGAPKSAVAQISLGDKLWKANKPDEAADAYREAIKLNPSDWRAYERLALVDASISMFTESRQAVEQLAKIQPNPARDVLSRRYMLFGTIFNQWFTTLFKQYENDSADYAKQIISRESYYSSIKGLNARLESMAKFLDALPVPEDKKDAELHRNLACGLLFQGVSSLQDYLETNSKESKTSADTFVAQAKKELDTAKSLEGNAVVVQRRPRPAPAQPAPPAQDTTSPAPDQSAGQPAPDQTNTQTAPDQSSPGQDTAPPPPPAPDQPGPGFDQGPPPPDQPMGGDANPAPNAGNAPM